MKKIVLNFWPIGMVFLWASCAEADIRMLNEEVKHLLPIDGGVVDVMTLGTSARCQELVLRLQQGVGRHPDWWLTYMKDVEPGRPLTYHPNFGLSEDEYKEFLGCTKTGMELIKKGEVEVFVKHEGAERYVLNAGNQLPELSGVVVDLNEQVVETPFGVCKQVSRVEASAGQTVTGPWSGYQWKFEKGGRELDQMKTVGQLMDLDITLVQFALGRFQGVSRGIMRYKVERLRGGLKEGFDVILTFAVQSG
ncbi:MAG: hypothetical protein HY606_04355 [Planctomycetes bacterium]|nr:hypothetical protein [Planctomycetota bacterium]